MSINKIMFLFIIILQKIYGATIKLHILGGKVMRKQISYWDFKLLHISLRKYLDKSLKLLPNIKYKGHYNSNIIWIFWWQGYYQMPRIVKDCVSSIKSHSVGHRIVLITKKNIRYYSKIPEYILKKVNNKQITLTHLSDILRFDLLNNYGGLWCDSTMFCTSDLNKSYFNYLYTSGGYKNTDPEFVKGRWTGFLIGGNSHNALFQFMCNYFNLYWKYNKRLINYFLIDLGLHYAYKYNIGAFKDYVDNVAYHHNPELFKLINLLNRPYNSNIYKYITSNTNMFKLTYKKEFKKNKNTFYNKLIN